MKITRWHKGHCFTKNVKLDSRTTWEAPCGERLLTMPSSAPKKLTVSMPAACPTCLDFSRK